MARDIKIIVWCDYHDEKGHRVEALPEPVAVWVGKRLVYLDLCEECRTLLVDPLTKLAMDRGVSQPLGEAAARKTKTAASSRGEPRNIKELEHRAAQGRRQGKPPTGSRHLPCLLCDLDYASDSGLRRHLVVGHRLPPEYSSYQNIYGETCPACGGNYAALGNHAMSAHNATTPVLFRQADEQGDPYGVVTKTRARLEQVIADAQSKGSDHTEKYRAAEAVKRQRRRDRHAQRGTEESTT